MGEWIDGWMDRRMDGLSERVREEWVVGWREGWMDGL